MKKTAISRADLLNALMDAGGAQSVPVSLLGYERRPDVATDESTSSSPLQDDKEIVKEPGVPKPPPQAIDFAKPKYGDRKLNFLVPTETRTLETEDHVQQVESLSDEELAQPRPLTTPIAVPTLVTWSRMAPFLRRQLGVELPGRRLDNRRLSQIVASGLPLVDLPRLQRQTWGSSALILWDTDPAMEPFQPDAERLVRRLKRERGKNGLKVQQCYGPPDSIPPLTFGIPVLAISALGRFGDSRTVRDRWDNLGRQLMGKGHPLTAISPCPRRLSQWQPGSSWPVAIWDRRPKLPRHLVRARSASSAKREHRSSENASSHVVELLLDLLSPAAFITPALLREVRLLVRDADAGTENEAWFHADGNGANCIRYFSLHPGSKYHVRLERRRRLSEAPETRALVREASSIIIRHHRMTSCPVIAAEASLRAHFTDGSEPAELEELVGLLQRAVERLRDLADAPDSAAGHRSGLASWFLNFVEQRLEPAMRAEPRVERWIAKGWILARKFLGCLDSDWPDQINQEAALAELRQHNMRGSGTATHDFRIGLRSFGLMVEPCLFSADLPLMPSLDIRAGQALLHIVEGDGGRGRLIEFHADRRQSVAQLTAPDSLKIQSDRESISFTPLTRPLWAARMWYDAQGIQADAKLTDGNYRFHWRLGGDQAMPLLDGGPLHRVGRWNASDCPAWADRMWVDGYGVAAELSIEGVAFVLRWIPPGRFLMGSPEEEAGRWSAEGPQHEVTISRGFWMGETPVTQAQWKAVVESRSDQEGQTEGLKPAPAHFGGSSDLPVEQVSWQDSREFCRLVNASLPEAPGFQLPTEAQWEYACRAGTQTAFFDGSACTEPEGKDPALDRLGWFTENSEGRTHEVKEKDQANEWGLYDMHGNVMEWCADAWQEDVYRSREGGAVDPEVRSEEESASRVVRGGSWIDRAQCCRAACRGWFGPGSRGGDLGLRLAAGQEPGAAEPPGAERPQRTKRRSRG